MNDYLEDFDVLLHRPFSSFSIIKKYPKVRYLHVCPERLEGTVYTTYHFLFCKPNPGTVSFMQEVWPERVNKVVFVDIEQTYLLNTSRGARRCPDLIFKG